MIEVELFRGPMDGLLWEIPDDQEIVIFQQPTMSPQEFLALDHRPDLIEFAAMQPIEHAYIRDRKQLSHAGRHRYVYAGVRASR
jgi:hypothetical protein